MLKELRRLSLIIFVGFYILAAFYQSEALQYTLALFMVIIILLTITVAAKTNRKVALVLLFLGCSILVWTGADLDQWKIALGANSGLVALFISLPFLSFPIQYEDYESPLQRFSLRYIKGVEPFGNFSALLTFFLLSLINIGAFQIIYNLFNHSQNFKKYENIFYLSLVRANFAAIFWSPNYVAVAVIIHYLDLPWINLVPLGLLMSAIILLSNFLLIKLYARKTAGQEDSHPLENTTLPKLEKNDTYKLWKLVFIFCFLITYVLALNIFTPLSILVIIPIIAITFPVLIALAQKKISAYKEQLRGYYHTSLLNIKNEVIIFAAAGFFGKSLEITGIGKLIPNLLGFNRIDTPFLIIIMMMLITGILAFIGIHPVVTSSTFATTISPITLGVSLEVYALILLASFGLAVMVSPFSGTTLVLAGVTKHSPWKMGPKLNILYSLGMGIFLALGFSFFNR